MQGLSVVAEGEVKVSTFHDDEGSYRIADNEGVPLRCCAEEDGYVISLDSKFSSRLWNRIVREVVECCNNHFSLLILRFFRPNKTLKLLSLEFLARYVVCTTTLHFFSFQIPFR